MNLKVVAFTLLFVFSTAFFCLADDLIWLEDEKEAIFNMAKEQDKFVLLLVGDRNCPLCNSAMQYFNDPTDKLRKIIDENYILWFESYYDPKTGKKNDMEHIALYIEDYDAHKYAGVSTSFPILAIINPDIPEEFTFFWTDKRRTVDELYKFISAPPDIFAGQELAWMNNKNEVLNLAKEEGKKVLKMVGRATSPNSRKVMIQLNDSPLKELLDDNYILWYSSIISDIPRTDSPASLPYISIFNPENPDRILSSVWGVQDVETLEAMLRSQIVSNEKTDSDNQVIVSGNVLHVSNQTNNEQIQIFTITGKPIATIRKTDYAIRMDASNFPKGVLIVHSSTGWSKKIIKY